MGRNRKGPRRRNGASTGHHHPHHPHLVLNEEGVPAARPDDPRPSPVVFVTEESLARYPWLPRRVIAGSHWRGPAQEKVWIDEAGNAALRRVRAVSLYPRQARPAEGGESPGEAA